jgi:FtsP/CotA-like multicopper oxidase with cupredoxin domain
VVIIGLGLLVVGYSIGLLTLCTVTRRTSKRYTVALPLRQAIWPIPVIVGVLCIVTLVNHALPFLLPKAVADTGQVGTPPSLSLTSEQIQRQNQLSVDTMNEKAMVPTILPDGTKRFTFTASEFAWNLYPNKTIQAWGINNEIPGPVIRVKVGDKVEFVVHNSLPESITIHWHGLSVPNDMDGVPDMPEPPIHPGGTFRYKFTVTNQMIGTHWYHSHYDDDFQVDSGMYGIIIVDPTSTAAEPHYDKDALFVLGSAKVDGEDLENVFTINGKAYPLTPQLTIKKGDKVLLRLVNASAETYHALTLDGYTLHIVSEDGQPLPTPQDVSVVSLAPSETMDVSFTATNPGTFLFHDTIANDLSNPDDTKDAMGGMMTLIHVN